MNTQQAILKINYHSTGETKVWLCNSELQAEAHASTFKDSNDITTEVFPVLDLNAMSAKMRESSANIYKKFNK